MFKFFHFIVNAFQILWQFLFEGAIDFAVKLYNYILQGVGFLEYLIVGTPSFAQGFLLTLMGIALASLFVGIIIKF